MTWKIILFQTPRGEKPVHEFIRKQQPQAVAKIMRTIDLLEKYGPTLGMPHAKKLTKDLYELRIRGKEEIRILYGFSKNTIYLLHVFKKQSQKTPPKEIELAIYRFSRLT